jgi:hypothetical protein
MDTTSGKRLITAVCMSVCDSTSLGAGKAVARPKNDTERIDFDEESNERREEDPSYYTKLPLIFGFGEDDDKSHTIGTRWYS